VFLVGCADNLPQGVVVRIDGEDMKYEDFERYVTDLLDADALASRSEVLSRLFERFVDALLLLRRCRDLGLVGAEASVDEAAAALLEAESPEVPAAEIESWYRDNRSDFARPRRARPRQILVEDRSAAEAALAELEAGAAFPEVARVRSIGPSAAEGGFQGELAREDLPAALAEVVFSLGEGEWSEVLEADYGLRIFQVDGFLPEEVLSLEAAAPSIRTLLAAERGDALLEAAVREARREYNLQVAVGRLPFEYRGVYGASGSVD